MATKIVTKNSSTASAVPTASDLVQGELAVNVADKRLFTEDNAGAIVELGTNPSTIDINAGSIDGTAIGASSASTGAFTTLTATGLTVDTNTFYVNSTNNRVGIGTTSPSRQLEIYDDGTNGQAVLALTAQNTENSRIMFADPDDNNIGILDYSHADDSMRFTVNNSERMRIDSSGRVGIGRTPSISNSKLEVGGADNVSLINVEASGVTGGMGIGSTGLQFFHGSSAKMRIDSSGNVGIGTSSAFGKLRIEDTGWSSGSPYGTVAYILGGDVNDANWGHLLVSQSSTTTGSGGKISFGSNGDNPIAGIKAYYAGATYGHLDFYTRPSGGTSTQRMRIDSSGNLLVGTTSYNDNVAGIGLSADNYFYVARQLDVANQSRVVTFNRKGADGSILDFAKDGTTVGSIGTGYGVVDIKGGSAGLLMGNTAVLPVNGSGTLTTDSYDIGAGSFRFKDLYLSGGVYLGGTGAANKLDDYEEGTWTPSFSGAGSPSYSIQYGRYTKVGRIVYCSITIRATSVSGSSDIEIAGLPFTPADAGDNSQRSTYSPSLGGHCSGLSEATGRFRIKSNTNMSGVKGTTSTTFMTAAEFSSGGSPQITGDFWYYTS